MMRLSAAGMQVTFEEWTQNRDVPSLGTNSGAAALPFQRWQRFKEAFAPELIERAVTESKIPVRSCLDPFGGSGTTALACQFLGVHPVIVEVSPYLADVIEAKLVTYESDALIRDLDEVLQFCEREGDAVTHFSAAPGTFMEPGMDKRWIFYRDTADRIVALLSAIESLPDADHRRLFRVLLGGILIDVSNIVVSGKGRRYRKGWRNRPRDAHSVDRFFRDSAQLAIEEIRRFGARKSLSFQVLRGDSRTVLAGIESADLAVFSPPYPNSFDYTDIHNVELWALGYLRDARSNRRLRASTLSSHVQMARNFKSAPKGSRDLDDTLHRLVSIRSELWNPWIPEMVGAYFADLLLVLDHVHRLLSPGGSTWIVVGDSQYAGIQIETATILTTLVSQRKWSVSFSEPFRSMRVSAQQGGRRNLTETLLVMSKAD